MSIPPKRACDACHRRKVRCNSRQPCGNCSQAGLACTYDAIPQKKGPKGSRAKVISELRETQKQTEWDLPGAKSRVHNCVEYYFRHLYPTLPILSRELVRQIIGEMAHSTEAYCLITALCSFMLIQPGIAAVINPALEEPASAITNPKLGTALMEEAVHVRKGCDYVENPNVNSIVTSFFLFGSSFGLNKHNTAWFHLREATASAQLMGLQDENTYLFGNVIESSRKRRLFWLLFVTERAYALQKHRPLTLHATIALPTEEQDPKNPINGFLYLVNLYRPFDDTFIGLWNKTSTDCSTYWLAQLQQQLTEALPAYLNTTEAQAADLRISQQWLRTMVWQLSITNGFLSSTSPDSSMTFRYPIEIAKDLVAVTSQLSKQSMEVHGVGLIEKLFDVACTLIDVMSCVPLPTNPATPTSYPSSHRSSLQSTNLSHLTALLTLISTLRCGEPRFLPLVMAKIRDTLPGITPALPPHLHGYLLPRSPATGVPVTMVADSVSILSNGLGGGIVDWKLEGLGLVNIKRESSLGSGSQVGSPYGSPFDSSGAVSPFFGMG